MASKDWRNAIISPKLDKEGRHTAANYRSVALNCVCYKMLKHIICLHIMNHLKYYNIVTHLHHCFHSWHACESQLRCNLGTLLRFFMLFLYQFNVRTNSGTLTAGLRTYWLVTEVWTAVLKRFTVSVRLWIPVKLFQSLTSFNNEGFFELTCFCYR